MSRYGLVAADLLARFTEQTLIQLTDGAATFDEETIETQIDAEENHFDGFAGVYYALPVRTATDTVPGVVRESLLDGVAIRLLSRKPEFVTDESDLQKFWRAARTELKDWKNGLSHPSRPKQIPDAVERAAPVATGGTAEASGEPLEYTASTMRGFR